MSFHWCILFFIMIASQNVRKVIILGAMSKNKSSKIAPLFEIQHDVLSRRTSVQWKGSTYVYTLTEVKHETWHRCTFHTKFDETILTDKASIERYFDWYFMNESHEDSGLMVLSSFSSSHQPYRSRRLPSGHSMKWNITSVLHQDSVRGRSSVQQAYDHWSYGRLRLMTSSSQSWQR